MHRFLTSEGRSGPFRPPPKPICKFNRLLFVALLSLNCISLRAQTLDVPKQEFSLSLSNEYAEIRKGDTLLVDLYILKSKDYQKGKATMGLSSGLPRGISVHFSPDYGSIEKTTVKITAGSEAMAGKYHLILNTTIRHHTKGIILTLVVL